MSHIHRWVSVEVQHHHRTWPREADKYTLVFQRCTRCNKTRVQETKGHWDLYHFQPVADNESAGGS